MIGPLQTNKVKYAVPMFDMIESLESIKVANEIEKRAGQIGKVMTVLIEIKISDEPTKHGISEKEVLEFLKQLSEYEYIKVKGIMSIAPLLDAPEKARPYFKKMKEIFEGLRFKNIPNVSMEILSMGMSGDYKIAIEEGSNFLRIGSAIFGDVYKK